jgi:hypothetical protein
MEQFIGCDAHKAFLGVCAREHSAASLERMG